MITKLLCSCHLVSLTEGHDIGFISTCWESQIMHSSCKFAKYNIYACPHM